MWIDVQKISTDSQELAEFIRQETGLIISAGSVYREMAMILFELI